MPPLTTETALNILIDWLQDNIIFDNNEKRTQIQRKSCLSMD